MGISLIEETRCTRCNCVLSRYRKPWEKECWSCSRGQLEWASDLEHISSLQCPGCGGKLNHLSEYCPRCTSALVQGKLSLANPSIYVKKNRYDSCPDCGRLKRSHAVRCKYCAYRHRQATSGRRCVDCGEKTSKRADRCRPCWIIWKGENGRKFGVPGTSTYGKVKGQNEGVRISGGGMGK